ncbi:hypothetical protein ARMSODRAFT_1080674 [Armillaria solidipes]|uniref:Protein kinase domain-containing protein n=1 Tax=Armillaria solidipes TaxID=1076256 RepID=A0A2H3C706_9AGAR|nr:hypothetical protein ARMSODRAFT_1080674 [Armillaria solidipes]
MGSESSDTGEQRRIGPATLLHGETFWHKHATWLKECGYELRPRFLPGCVPSWTVTKKEPYECEDSSSGMRSYAFMDAKDTSTGQIVAMKLIMQENEPNELEIATFLTSEEKFSDRRNHCVPILRLLPVPNEEGHVIIVMPYLRPWYDPKFKTIGEGVHFFREMFEGLQFIHHNRVVHYDGGFTDIMMDATSMFGPDSFHPDQMDLKYDFSSRARYRSRTERPPKYYYIDFGLSILFKPNELPATRTPKHDPFAVDIYYLGNAFRAFLPRGVGADYKLSEKALPAMTEPDPTKQIKIDEAVEKFAQVEKSLSAMTLRSRVVYNTDFTIFRPFKAVGRHWVWTLGLTVRGIPATPKLVPQ